MNKPLIAHTLPHQRPTAAPPASVIGSHGVVGHRDFNRPASSIGLTYDRSHVTGASSSTASSQGFNRHHQLHQHPPSPATTAYNDLRNRSQYHIPRHQQQELPRTSTLGREFPTRSHHGRVKNYYQKPHNTTPASTDFEADYSGLPSRTISEFQGGYATQDDSEYYGQFARQHPPTPQQVQSDFYNRSDDEEEYGGDFRSGPISDFHDDDIEMEEEDEDDSRVVIRAPAPSPIPQ